MQESKDKPEKGDLIEYVMDPEKTWCPVLYNDVQIRLKKGDNKPTGKDFRITGLSKECA